ncbi:MAG: 5,10-methylenetetrahydrofolate reductase [Desulfobacteraceae bacterium]|nr:MAG: 5,10-methylenetetrahydrofolate reductase [Desulfobacteraceae bacterium]
MRLKSKLEKGEFAVLVELEPPKGVDVSLMLANAKKVKGKVDAFVVPEMSNAVMRMSSLGGALILNGNGLETVFQVNCRDRNRIALQADLLSAGAVGINNVMAVKGEDPRFGDHHETKSVNDLDLLELIRTVNILNNGKDMAGIELAGAPRFIVGSTVNAGAGGQALMLELDEMKKKLDAGTGFFITQPVFDVSGIRPFLERVDRSKIRIIPTVLLLKSVGMVKYIERHMDNIKIPGATIDRIQNAPDRVRECIKIASENVSMLKKEGFSGAFISTLGWENKLPEILE